MDDGVNKKRPRGGTFKNTDEQLKRILREIAIEYQEELNPNKLEKITTEKGIRIERRQWKRVQESIDAINYSIRAALPEHCTSLSLPPIEETFDLYYGHSKGKMIEIFSGYNDYINQMWAKCCMFDAVKKDYEIKLAEKEREIDALKEKLKAAKKDKEYYEERYNQICVQSWDSGDRKRDGIAKNVIKLEEKKDMMSMDFASQFADILTKPKKEK